MAGEEDAAASPQQTHVGGPGNFAPSLALWYKDTGLTGDILVHDVMVPKAGLAQNTYYCCLQWNGGENGGGYCGIQDHPRGRNFIFSLWNPKFDTRPDCIRATYKDPGTEVLPFGNEGTGMKSWNFSINWNVDVWYTLVTRRWDRGPYTCFGFWVCDNSRVRWTHLVTMEFPLAGVYFNPGTACFLEDWAGSGQNSRHVYFRNGLKRDKSGAWHPLRNAHFTVNQEERCRHFQNAYDAGFRPAAGGGSPRNSNIPGDHYYLASGGCTSPSQSLKPSTDFTPASPSGACSSPRGGLAFRITSVTSHGVEWLLDASSTPQFKYTLEADGKPIASDVDSERRHVFCDIPHSKLITLVIEDIFGGNCKQTMRTLYDENKTHI